MTSHEKTDEIESLLEERVREQVQTHCKVRTLRLRLHFSCNIEPRHWKSYSYFIFVHVLIVQARDFQNFQ